LQQTTNILSVIAPLRFCTALPEPSKNPPKSGYPSVPLQSNGTRNTRRGLSACRQVPHDINRTYSFKQINGQAPNQKRSGRLRALPVVHNTQRHCTTAVKLKQ